MKIRTANKTTMPSFVTSTKPGQEPFFVSSSARGFVVRTILLCGFVIASLQLSELNKSMIQHRLEIKRLTSVINETGTGGSIYNEIRSDTLVTVEVKNLHDSNRGSNGSNTTIPTNDVNEGSQSDEQEKEKGKIEATSTTTTDNGLNTYSYQQHKVGTHQHTIPAIIILTHRDNFLTTAYPFKDKPSNDLTLHELELLALQQNVFDIGKTHPESTMRFLTDDDCIASIRVAMNAINNNNEKVTEQMVQYFINESQGMYKADMCRGAALYETGGLYFDADIGVRYSLWNAVQPRTEFVTVKALVDYPGNEGGFFQAFMGATKHHPVIRRYLELFFDFYSGNVPDAYGTLLGVYLLGRAYDEILMEQTAELLENTSYSSIIKTSKSKERWERYKVNDHKMIIDKQTNETITNLLQGKRTMIDETSQLWEEYRYDENLMTDVPVPNWGNSWECAIVVIVKDDDENETKIKEVPMYSRIAHSHAC